MDYYFITGTSRGIGKALAELLLQDNNNFVYGLSRTNTIENVNFKFINLDLGNIDDVKKFEFPEFENESSIALVNNSAAKSEVLRLGKRSPENITDTYNVNIVSPSLLMNNFLHKYQKKQSAVRVIMNISSGAGKRPIESWSIYCATKAALEMISEVVSIEQKLKYPNNPVHIFAVGPGVVNTKMQDELRKVSPEDFSMVGMFIEYKEKNQLAEPADIAVKLRTILMDPGKFDMVSLNLKEM